MGAQPLGPYAQLGDYNVVKTPREAVELSDRLLRLGAIAFDTETTGLDNMRDEIVCFSLSDGKNRWFVPLQFLGIFQPLFENPSSVKICHNIKFDAHMLKNHGIILGGPWHDTLTMAWLADETTPLALKERFNLVYGCLMPSFETIFGKFHTLVEQPSSNGIVKLRAKRRKETLPEAFIRVMREEPDLAHNYASADAKMHWLLWEHYSKELQRIEFAPGFSAWDHFTQVEVPFTKILWGMETRGFRIDRENLLKAEPVLRRMEDEIAQEFNQLAGPIVAEHNRSCAPDDRVKPFIDMGSTTQLAVFLFDVLKYPTPEGGRSTDEEALENLIETKQCPYSSVILRYREVTKLKQTYVDKLLRITWVDGNIHTSLRQAGTVTGRLSSADPNLQNIPRPDNDRSNIRGTFIASPGYRLIVGDYAQLEMRIMAHYSEDAGMLEAIWSDKDLHTYTAARMFGYTYEELVIRTKAAKNAMHAGIGTDEDKQVIQLRIAAKRINFGIIYGMSAKGLAVQLAKEGVFKSKHECQALLDQYFGTFPGVHSFILRTHAQAAAAGYVTTLAGRRRRFPVFAHGGNYAEISRAERQSVNAPIQGTAADIVKNAMILCDRDQELKSMFTYNILQVHDELVFETPDDDAIANYAQERIKYWMEHPLPRGLIVPLPVDLNQGHSWAEAK